MKKDFETFYEELKNEDLRMLWEQINNKNRNKNKIVGTIILIQDIIFAILYFKFFVGKIESVNTYLIINSIPLIFGCLFTNLFIIIISKLFGSKDLQVYNILYKEKIIEPLLHNCFDEVDYIPKKVMPEQIYKEAGFNEFYDNYKADDYVDAKIENRYTIKMSEILTTREEETIDSKGNRHTHIKTVFSGLYTKIEIGKSINNEVKITINYGVSGKEKLNMDSSEFEKYFDVACIDKILGMRLLTHDVMEILVELRKALNAPFEIYIKQNKMYVRLHVGRMFEGIVTKNEPIDKQYLKKYYDVLDYLNSLAKEVIKIVNEIEI